jgi:aryl-alcohol dehydrogenase-like predicted oxidoreductase
MARLQTMADLRGWTQLAALQVEYSLLQRTTERELIPAARALGLGVMPWSPLASGVLSGKYAADASPSGDPPGGRKELISAAGRVNAASVAVADGVKKVADAMGVTPAQVAIAWTLANPAVTSSIVGARSVRQLNENLGALKVSLDDGQKRQLDEISRIELGFPHDFLNYEFVRQGLFAGTRVRPR